YVGDTLRIIVRSHAIESAVPRPCALDRDARSVQPTIDGTEIKCAWWNPRALSLGLGRTEAIVYSSRVVHADVIRHRPVADDGKGIERLGERSGGIFQIHHVYVIKVSRVRRVLLERDGVARRYRGIGNECVGIIPKSARIAIGRVLVDLAIV